MARQLRLEYEGAIYHVTVRSNGGEALFKGDKDRVYLLSRIKECTELHGVRVYLFCLMTNHFHLVVETPKGNLSRFMQSVLTGYTVYFNLRHGRHGHVTQGRYGARLVEGDEYLLKLSRYVHLNPVHVKNIEGKPVAERLEMLRGYRWSSYPGYSGTGARYELVEEGPMLALAGGKGEKRRKEYRRFVEEGLKKPDEEFDVEMWRSPRSIGSEKFRQRIDDCYADKIKGHNRKEDVSFRRDARKRLSVEKVEKVVAKACGVRIEDLKEHRRDRIEKGIAGMMLVKYADMTQREASKRLGLKTGAGVSYQVRKLTKQMEHDKELRLLTKRIIKKLDSLG